MDTAVLRFPLSLAMLGGAAILDLRSRRVANLYWAPFGLFALALAATDLLAPGADPRALGVTYGVAALLCGFFYLLWRLRLFGGADAKALMVLAFLLPRPFPDAVPIPPVLAALACASLASLAVPVAYAVLNLARGHWAFPALFLGPPMDLERARRAHVWPMQEPDGAGGLRWRYTRHVGSDLEARFADLEKSGVHRVWVTPKIPFLLFLAVGLPLAAWAIRSIPWPP
jgi:preflagellin peptidase FlaK